MVRPTLALQLYRFSNIYAKLSSIGSFLCGITCLICIPIMINLGYAVVNSMLLIFPSFFFIGISKSLYSLTNEYEFASKWDMTHLLDIDSKEERFAAYKKHLEEWANYNDDVINPLRKRGEDPSGPDWGKTDFKLGHKPQRRDAIVEGEKYKGMEGELTSSEKMVATANEKYAGMAQKRWEKAEAGDSDLVEYGVERLGDLVKTEYFEKNAEEGIFAKTADKNED